MFGTDRVLWTERLDPIRNARLWSKRADEAENLTLGAMLGEQQELAMVLFGEVRCEEDDRGEVQLAVCNVLKDNRKLPSDSGCARAAEGGVLRESQFEHAIHEEAGAGPTAMDAACLDLGEMSEQFGKDLIRSTDEAACAGEQVVVRDMR